MFEALEIKSLFDMNATIAAELFDGKKYPWEVLPDIKDFIIRLGETLPESEFERRGENIWVSRSAVVASSAFIGEVCIIDAGAEIRHCAFVRGSAVIGKNTVIGNSTEVKNAVIFDGVQVPHFNYVGDSVLGAYSHMGAGSVTSNVKSDKTLVEIKSVEGIIATGRKKAGAFLGDRVEVGCNSVLCPGTVIGRGASVYPTSCVRGFIPANSIYKDKNNITERV